MYVVRGCASFLRAIVLIRTAACGRIAPPWTGCDAGPFNSQQARTAFRAIHLLGALRGPARDRLGARRAAAGPGSIKNVGASSRTARR